MKKDLADAISDCASRYLREHAAFRAEQSS